MKYTILFLTATLATILFFPGCSDSGGSSTVPDIEMAVLSCSMEPLPLSYSYDDGTLADLSVSVRNNGNDIPPGSIIVVSIMTADSSGLDWNHLIPVSTNITSWAMDTGLAANGTWDESYDDFPISQYGMPGDNYYYAVVYVMDESQNMLFDDETMADNVFQVSSTACVMSPLSHSAWAPAVTIAGGANQINAVLIDGQFEQWITSELSAGNEMWYSIMVNSGTDYEVYLDSVDQGSGNYTGSVLITVTHTFALNIYGVAIECYLTPITATADEATIYIKIEPYENGTFAFGIQEKP